MTKDEDTVAVWFSCGAASAVALQKNHSAISEM